MKKFKIEMVYPVLVEKIISLPVQNWEEINDWKITHDIFSYTMDGKNWEEIPLNTPDSGTITTMDEPMTVEIYEETELRLDRQ